MRTIFPRMRPRFCALSSGSPPPPPSPNAAYSFPSGPNWTWPPLWLKREWATRMVVRREPGSARSGFPDERRNCAIVGKPSWSV